VATIAGDNIDRLTSDWPKLVSLFEESGGRYEREEKVFSD
jgi:hypothetical protein